MGFWHTGYMEFHEPEGLRPLPEPLPPRFPCLHCGEEYASLDELRKHRFESHPLSRPVMFLRGRELGTHPVRITWKLSPGDMRIANCDRAVFNGDEIPLSSLSNKLAGIASDVCKVTLSKSGVDAEFELDIRLASNEDLEGIEKQFMRMAQSRRLDMRAVDEFIRATSKFGSAIGYCDGICAYLYGVLVKERAPDSSLPYDAYIFKFNKAAEELADYDRPLARTIGSLVGFHFNHFRESARLSPNLRIGSVADRYAAWIESRRQARAPQPPADETVNHTESLLTDWETEQIIRWGSRPLPDLLRDAENIESFLNKDLAEFDKVKLRVLLGEIYAESGEAKRAMEHAKALRHLPSLEKWAEAMIQAMLEDNNDHA
jgi:hypothetical protein